MQAAGTFRPAAPWRNRLLAPGRRSSRSEVRSTGQALTDINTVSHQTPRTTVDLRLEYSISRWNVPFVPIRNLCNAPIENTQNDDLLNSQGSLDPRLESGVRGNG